MKTAREFVVLFLIVCASGQALGQATPPAAQPWEYNVVVDGYIIPDGTSYVDPVFTADHNWLHLEARYNYENLHTGSLWVGYNFSWGKKVQFSLTPMIGGIFGRSNGIAPGGEASLTYKRIQGSILAATHLLAGGVATCGRRRATYQGLPYAARHPAWVPSGRLAQELGFHDLCVQSGSQRHDRCVRGGGKFLSRAGEDGLLRFAAMLLFRRQSTPRIACRAIT